MLEIDEDLSLQSATWRIQRAGWVLAVIVLAATSAGFLGGSQEPNQTMDVAGMTVAYASPQRLGSESRIVVQFPGESGEKAKDASLSIGDSFLAKVGHLEFTPPPVEMISKPGSLRVRFAPVPAKVSVRFTPVEWGRLPIVFGGSQDFGTSEAYVLP